MRNVFLLGAGALAAGMLFGAVSLGLSHPASAVLPEVIPLATEPPIAVQNAFLASPLPTMVTNTPLPADTATPVPTETPIPLTPTPVPPTPTPTIAAPVKTGAAAAPNVNAWSVAVVDEASGALLYGHDPHRHLA